MLRRLGRACALRCPNCGGSSLWQGWTRLRSSCPTCDHRFERQQGYWLGAIAINTIATILMFAAVLVVSLLITWPDPPWLAITVAVVAVTVVFPVVFYPWSKMIWVAIDLSAHPP